MVNLQPLLDLFDSREKWTRHTFARDKNGWPVPAQSEQAVSWCLDGGVQHHYRDNTEYAEVLEALYAALPKRHRGNIELIVWNDSYATFIGLRRLIMRAQKGQIND